MKLDLLSACVDTPTLTLVINRRVWRSATQLPSLIDTDTHAQRTIRWYEAARIRPRNETDTRWYIKDTGRDAVQSIGA